MPRKKDEDRRVMLLAPVEATDWLDPLNILLVHFTIGDLNGLSALSHASLSLCTGTGRTRKAAPFPGRLARVSTEITGCRLARPEAAVEWVSRNQIEVVGRDKKKTETWLEYAAGITTHIDLTAVYAACKLDIRMASKSSGGIDEPSAFLDFDPSSSSFSFRGSVEGLVFTSQAKISEKEFTLWTKAFVPRCAPKRGRKKAKAS